MNYENSKDSSGNDSIYTGDTTGISSIGTSGASSSGNSEQLTSANLAEAVAELHDGRLTNAEVAAQGISTYTGAESLYAAHPNLKPGIPVEDIGVTESQAAALGLLKSEADYHASKAAEIAEAEAYNHMHHLYAATSQLTKEVDLSLAAIKTLGEVVNQSYGKFMLLGMAAESEQLRNLNSNIHFNAIIENLEECKARAYLLSVELQSL